MVRLALLLALPRAALAAPAPPESPYFVAPVVDGTVDVFGAALIVVPFFVFSGELSPPSCVCDPARVNSFDRLTLPLHEAWATPVAGVMLGAMAPLFLALELGDPGARHWRGWLVDLLVVGQSLIVSAALNEIVRRAVMRPRPYLYTPDLFPDRRNSIDADFSFFSGHTAMAFALAMGIGLTFQLRHPASPWRWVVWSSVIALAATEGVLRVVSGEHFPTDVLVGALVGTGVGLSIPALHLRRGGPLLRVLPTVSSDGAGVAIGAVF